MLDRLRPLVLEQMGLSEALRQLFVSWQIRYHQIIWSLVMPRGFDGLGEAMNLTLYRIVEQAVTNVIRHAEASALELRFERAGGDDEPRSRNDPPFVVLSITDNGRGLPENFRYGFGLLGMSERVRQLGGTLQIKGAYPKGVVVQALIPERAPAAIEEPTHADSSG